MNNLRPIGSYFHKKALDTLNNLGTIVPKTITESQLRPLTNYKESIILIDTLRLKEYRLLNLGARYWFFHANTLC